MGKITRMTLRRTIVVEYVITDDPNRKYGENAWDELSDTEESLILSDESKRFLSDFFRSTEVDEIDNTIEIVDVDQTEYDDDDDDDDDDEIESWPEGL